MLAGEHPGTPQLSQWLQPTPSDSVSPTVFERSGGAWNAGSCHCESCRPGACYKHSFAFSSEGLAGGGGVPNVLPYNCAGPLGVRGDPKKLPQAAILVQMAIANHFRFRHCKLEAVQGQNPSAQTVARSWGLHSYSKPCYCQHLWGRGGAVG